MTGLRIAYLPELVGRGGLLSPCSSIRTDYYLKQLAIRSKTTIRHIYEARLLQPELFDVIFINRLALATVEEARHLLHRVKSDGLDIPVILDLDDDLLSIPSDHVDYERIRPRLEALALLVHQADAVIVSTPELARALPREKGSVHVVPNRVLLPRIRALPAQAFSGSRRVLYFGTSSHVHELHTLQPLFDPQSPSYTGLELVVAGIVTEASSWYRTIDVLHPCVETFLEKLSRLQGFRCGLAPLRVDDPLNRCKSEIKVFDYSYLGLPVIATVCPQYARTIEHGRTGYLVTDSHEDWSHCLELLQSDQHCAELSANAASHLSSIAPKEQEIVSAVVRVIQSASRHKSITRAGIPGLIAYSHSI